MSDPSQSKRPSGICGIRLRAAALIVAMQAVMIWWVVDSEIARGIYLICYSLMMPTVLYLLLARVLRRWLPFEDRELMLVYIVLTCTIPVIGYGGLRFAIHAMGAVPYYAQTQPQWVQYLASEQRLPVLHDPEAIRALYLGGPIHWRAWTIPIAYWSAYLVILSVLWLCLAAILRRVWIHQERLTFPVATLPLKLSDPKDDIFRRPLFWLGFAIPAILQSLLAINAWYPNVPAFQLKAWDIKPLIFTTPPWNAMPNFPVGFYPMAVGLAYFVPSSVSFSCWFFAVVMKLSYVVGAVFGVEGAGTGAARFPYKDEQAAGAWIGLALLVLWGARRHWRTVAAAVPKTELRLVRRSALVALACTVLCAAMMAGAGIPPIAAIAVITVYAAYVLSGARIRAEAGAQWTFAPVVWTPHRVADAAFGTQNLDTPALAAIGHFDMVHVDVRAQSLPYLMEGLDISERSGIGWRVVMKWVLIGTVTAIAIGWFFTLVELHGLGATSAKANIYPMMKVKISYDAVERIRTSPSPWDREGVAAMGFAAGLTTLLAWSRRLSSMGLHPIGYVMCNSLTMGAFVVPFFIAWAAKTLTLRLGGSRAYKRSVPFFVGVVLGDIVIQAFWAIVGALFDVPIYQFLT